MNKYLFRIIFGVLACIAGISSAEEQSQPKIIFKTAVSDADKAKIEAAIKESLRKKTVCLNMIVKDEEPVIRRCLGSVRPLIDHWVIVDTGSSDKTIEVIKEFYKDIPGEIYQRPWKNFGYNRNEALQLAKGKADYILFIDADEVLKFDENFKLPPLNRDFYYIQTRLGGTTYDRVGMIKASLDWEWKDVLHEYLHSPKAHSFARLDGVYNYPSYDGARARDPEKYKKDAKTLEEALKTDPDNARYVYYLAQSYKDAGELELALKNYEKRVSLGGWDQEVYCAMIEAAHLKWRLDYPENEIIEAYKKAYEYRPTRIEAIYYLAEYMRQHDMNEYAYTLLQNAIKMPRTTDNLFVQSWIYDYGLLFDLSIASYWVNKYQECLDECDTLLKMADLPESIREATIRNRQFAVDKLKEQSNSKQTADAMVLE